MDLGPADALRTLVHECAHENLHWNQKDQDQIIEETEADAVAYIVCKHFGIQCDTADYLLLYHSTPEILLSRLETIRKTAHHIITSINAEIPGEAENDKATVSATNSGANITSISNPGGQEVV